MLQKRHFAVELCENRAKGDLSCAGKCKLVKMIKNDTEQQSQQSPSVLEADHFYISVDLISAINCKRSLLSRLPEFQLYFLKELPLNALGIIVPPPSFV